MPHSYHYGKTEAIEFIQKYTTPESKILDVGPGVGTYADFLKPFGINYKEIISKKLLPLSISKGIVIEIIAGLSLNFSAAQSECSFAS